ncbi:MAG: hypothetical protein EBX95_10460, partial [Acidimicrobiia bacterium]|nr:hypothetical protein [Acidimicrobiia bacterium]
EVYKFPAFAIGGLLVGPSFIGARVAGSGAPQPADSDSAAALNFLSFNIGFAMSGLLSSAPTT